MNPHKTEDLFHHHFHHHHHHHDLGPPPSQIMQSPPSISLNPDDVVLDDPVFPPLPEIDLFRSSSSSPSHSSDENDDVPNPNPNRADPNSDPKSQPFYISPEPHISTQFYTFNPESHSLMIKCLLEARLATPAEIRAATPRPVLKSWRVVWKDRNEDTAYVTAWKRIQDKLAAHVDQNGNEFLCFKNNNQQFVSHINQWQDIVMSFHSDTDLKHLALKETIDRIKQVWTVGAKFYGIPESYIRVCVAACPVCSSENSGLSGRSKRRRFEYTESFDVPAKEVPTRLQQLAAKHKGGEPAAKKSKILKREPYASKRCGCGFRIRAIVPIANYNEKDKTFVYQEEGWRCLSCMLCIRDEPGPLDGNARIMHRVVGHKGGLLMDQDTVYGVSEELDNDGFGLLGKDEGDMQFLVLQQVQELRAEVGQLEEKIVKLPQELLGSVSRDLFDLVNKVRQIGEESSKPMDLLPDKTLADDILVGDNDLAHWSDHHHERLYGDGKDTDLIEDDEDSFGRTLGDAVPWEQLRADCRSPKDLIGDPCKPEKWLRCSDFDEKSILSCEDTKLTKSLRHDEGIAGDVGLVGIQVDSFYQGSSKWFDSPCGLDPGADCGDSAFRNGEIV
ncbi:uncharacterized protein Pyn_30492 [Prunus yedoensis var. nudiflora]|uniref:Uncharacterized protein n=1 Tax=Prunus yedoensis var. nudiflora TaxID=2094558 RepID=A0A314UQD5_PRUYE|nr:uncharacterized protein Pyn_30492 [Prunus yedoensis var. nudiflora]